MNPTTTVIYTLVLCLLSSCSLLLTPIPVFALVQYFLLVPATNRDWSVSSSVKYTFHSQGMSSGLDLHVSLTVEITAPSATNMHLWLCTSSGLWKTEKQWMCSVLNTVMKGEYWTTMQTGDYTAHLKNTYLFLKILALANFFTFIYNWPEFYLHGIV